MALLQPDRIQKRYAELVELAHSRLPALAPLHTDHNAHDPGITLIELLAAVAEAQLYAVGRIRRDERDAFAALMGVQAHGTRPASGLLWPERSRPDAPANTYKASLVIAADAHIRLRDSPEPVFRPLRPILWVPGAVRQLTLRAAGGAVQQFAALNERGSGFMPLGENPSPRDVLVLTFQTSGSRGLLPAGEALPANACWAIGVRVAGSPAAQSPPQAAAPSLLSAVLVAGQRRYAVPIVDDSSAGLLRTGHLLLDLSAVEGSPTTFSIEFSAPHGLALAPRVLQLLPNVLPITQRREISDEALLPTGLPGFSQQLEQPGLCFEPDSEPLQISSREGGEPVAWRRCNDLALQGPADRVFELDLQSGRVRFGNGINGMRPPAVAPLTPPYLFATYAVCDGEQGNVARNRTWIVGGIDGVFGSNPDPIGGGAGTNDRQQMRSLARRSFDSDRALVSAADVRKAAAQLPLLGVVRTWLAPRDAGLQHTGTVRLIAMRERADAVEPAESPESVRWLGAIQRALAPRLPLGTRLVVAAPRYRSFSIRAQLVAGAGRDPAVVERDARAALADRLRLVPRHRNDPVRAPGVVLTARDVIVWLLNVAGVADVTSLTFFVDRQRKDRLDMPADGLPRLDTAGSVITVGRPGLAGASS